MIRHIILWKLKDEFSESEKETINANVKKALEALPETIDNILKMEVIINGLDTSTCDMMLFSEFTDEKALKAYKVHPDHQHAANTYVRPNVEIRLCMDYEI